MPHLICSAKKQNILISPGWQKIVISSLGVCEMKIVCTDTSFGTVKIASIICIFFAVSGVQTVSTVWIATISIFRQNVQIVMRVIFFMIAADASIVLGARICGINSFIS